MAIASRRRPRRMAPAGIDLIGLLDGHHRDRTKTAPRRRPQERRSRDEPGSSIPPRGSRDARHETTIDAAMEMTRLWKSQNDFHSRLRISLENARFSHSHSRSAFSDEKRRPENERYEVNHVPHTEFLTLPRTIPHPPAGRKAAGCQRSNRRVLAALLRSLRWIRCSVLRSVTSVPSRPPNYNSTKWE